jgi:hypothetical protein
MKFVHGNATDIIYMSVYGKGKEVGLRIKHPDTSYSESFSLYLDEKEAKQFLDLYKRCYDEMCEKAQLPDDEEEN